MSPERPVQQVRAQVVAKIEAEQATRMAAGTPLGSDDVRRLATSLTRAQVATLRREQMNAGQVLPEASEDALLVQAVLDALFGMGPLQSLLDDEDLIEVNLNGTTTWVTHLDGRKAQVPSAFPTQEDLIAWVQAQAMYTGVSSRAWDAANPIVELQIEGGHRLVGIREAGAQVFVSIRLLRLPQVSLDDLRAMEDFDAPLQGFLEALMAARFNLIISGATKSAKTTLLRALSATIDPQERIVVIEHFHELGIDTHTGPDGLPLHPDVVPLQERVANSEGVGAIEMHSLVRTSRRLSPDRLIVGECVGEEVVEMLDALSQGNDGGLTTIHAKSARAVPSRIATYAHRRGMGIGAALHLTSQAVDFIIHMSRVRRADGTEGRKITSIVEVIGFDATADQVVMSQVYTWTPGAPSAYPAAAISEARTEELVAVGWDPRTHHGPDNRHGGPSTMRLA